MADQTIRNSGNASGASSSSSMASCSSLISYNSYDVFINIPGPDVKTTFATDLYRSLNSRGLRVFLDKPELEVGQNITPQVLHAIETSFIHIAIFSSTYAESKWCLDELLHMLNAFQSRPNEVTIIPLFYGVKPSELRWNTKGPYAEALSDHEKKQRFDFNAIQNWRRALSEAAEISGLDLEAFNGNVEQLLDDVLRWVSKVCDKTPLKYVAEHPVGLKEKLEAFESTVLWPEKTKVFGIVGAGGVGKTTLATEFFSKRRSNYNRSGFLYDVRENAAKGSLPSLQRKLLKQLTGLDLPINNIHEGTGMLVRHLSSSHILIILDDVDEASQLEAFLPIKHIVNPNSLILITSRDKKVLNKAKVAEASIYELEGLNRQHSKELFCFHAFGQPHPQPEFADLAYQFLTACDGLPLSLKVFGALLFGENERSYWEETLNRLHHLPPEIQERLRISYDSLNPEERQIFLNVCCFFIGEDRDTAARIWGSAGLRNIENKCLFKTDSKYKIQMHDHVRDLGRSIAEKEEIMPRGLWHHTTNNIDDLLERSARVRISIIQSFVLGLKMNLASRLLSVLLNKDFKVSLFNIMIDLWCGHFLAKKQVISKVRGIKMANHSDRISDLQINRADRISDLQIMMESSEISWYKKWCEEVLGNCLRYLFNNFYLRGISNLQLVATTEGYLERILRRARSPQLVWLCWYKCGYSCLPPWIPMESLRVLEVAGAKLKLLWQRESQAPLQLRELNICAPLLSFPKSIGQLKHLEKIAIFHALFKTMPEEFCDLPSLKYLELRYCSEMVLLPDSFGTLKNLQHIDLSGALSLQMLPNSFGNLTRLKHLVLRGCCSLIISNGAFGNITTLEHIDLSGCSNVKELPSQIPYQRSLKTLDVCKTKLSKLPSGIGDICKLEALELGGEPLLEMLPTLFGCLKSLKELFLFNCSKLKCLPDSFGLVSQLIELKICRCGIEYLPRDILGMKNLEILIVEDCPLRELPFIKAEGECDFLDDKCMLKLKQLVLARTQISDVFFHEGVCPNLQYMFFVESFELGGIRGLCHLAKLQFLYVSPGLNVEALPAIEHHLIPIKEEDVTPSVWVSSEVWVSSILTFGRRTNAMMYLNKCLETGDAKDLNYLMDQWLFLLMAAKREDEEQGFSTSSLFMSRGAYR